MNLKKKDKNLGKVEMTLNGFRLRVKPAMTPHDGFQGRLRAYGALPPLHSNDRHSDESQNLFVKHKY